MVGPIEQDRRCLVGCNGDPNRRHATSGEHIETIEGGQIAKVVTDVRDRIKIRRPFHDGRALVPTYRRVHLEGVLGRAPLGPVRSATSVIQACIGARSSESAR